MQFQNNAPSYPVSAQSVDSIMKDTLSGLPWSCSDSAFGRQGHTSNQGGIPTPALSPCNTASYGNYGASPLFNYEFGLERANNDRDDSKVYFPKGFVPSVRHVICGRGKRSYGHIGNKTFSIMVANSGIQDMYELATTKQEKTDIVQSIVDSVEAKGGFVRLDLKTGLYYKAGGQSGREKTSQALRDCLKHKYKSSKDIKRQNRKERRLAKKSVVNGDTAFSVHSQSSSAAASVTEEKTTKKGTINSDGINGDPPALSIQGLLKKRAQSFFQKQQQQHTAGYALVAEALQGPSHFQAHFTTSDGKQDSLLALPSPASDAFRGESQTEVPSRLPFQPKTWGANFMLEPPSRQAMPGPPSLCRTSAQRMGIMTSSSLLQPRSVSLSASDRQSIMDALRPLQPQDTETDTATLIEPIPLDLQDLDEMSELSELDGWEILLEDK